MDATREQAALRRRVEEAGLNALPAPFQVLLQGWLLRFAHGFTRRANSVTCLAADVGDDLAARIEACERLYAGKGLPTLFRVLSFHPPALDHALTARGYLPAEGGSGVLWTRLDAGGLTQAGVELTEHRAPDEWLAAQTRLAGASDTGQRAILDRLAVPVVFAAMRLGGPGTPMASLACGAVHDGIVTLQMVVTDAAARRRGLGRRTVAAVLAWAHQVACAREACLQVSTTNTPALRLYDELGFRTELYRYHYRRRPSGPRSPPMS